MEFSIMVLLTAPSEPVVESVFANSIFGVTYKGKPGLPIIPGSIWDSHRTVREDRFKFAAEAKKSIEKRGYYLIGGKDNIAEIENPPPDEDENALPPWASPD